MELPEFAPVCPPGIHGELASFFVDCGWAWGDELLRDTVALLAAQDIGGERTPLLRVSHGAGVDVRMDGARRDKSPKVPLHRRRIVPLGQEWRRP